MNGLQWLLLVSSVSNAVPVGVAFFRYQQYDRILRLVAVFMLISLGFDYVQSMLSLVFRRNPDALNTLPFVHVFTAVMAFFIGRMYELTFIEWGRLATGVRLGVGVLLVGIGLNALPLPFSDGFWNYPSQALTAEGLFFLVLSLLYFYRLFTAEEPVMNLERMGMFWVNSAVFIYFSLDFFAFMFFKSGIEGGNAKLQQNIHLITNLIVNLFYAVGLLCKIARPQS